MSTGISPAVSLQTSPQRRIPRYKLAVPLDLTVLRSGVPDSIPGRTLEIGEGGMGVVAASQLLLGEFVRVEFLLPHMSSPVRATAVVRYQTERCFGLQFLRLPIEQKSIIRYWTRRQGEVLLVPRTPHAAPDVAASDVATSGEVAANLNSLPGLENFEKSANLERSRPRLRLRRIVAFAVPLMVLAIAATLGWMRWQQGWAELEAQLPENEIAVAQPQFKLPADIMEQRIIHQAMPVYPEPARQAGVQGTVVLDAVVSPQGTVAQVKFVSGPEGLSHAAMDAVQWWRYQPYLVNGQAVAVETPVIVNFRLAN
jgi:TonB family protein